MSRSRETPEGEGRRQRATRDVKRRRRRFILHFAFRMALIILTLSLIMAVLGYIAARSGFFTMESPAGVLVPIAIFVVLSMVVGTSLTLFGGKRTVSPITELSEALVKLMSGDFSVRVNEEVPGPDELRELMRNFNKLARTANSAVKMGDEFMADFSHEFKTPVAAIEGYAALIAGGNLTESEQKEYAEIIRDGAHSLSVLANNILSLSKLENMEIIAQKSDFMMDELMRRMLIMQEAQWSEKGIEIDLDLAEIRYSGNAEMIGQVFSNIFSNAVKFTPRGGIIAAKLYEDGDNVTAIISDNGIGMSEEVAGRIFDKFYQGDSARMGEGNGLGLALVKQIMDMCSGSISVRSAEGGGSTFTVVFPKNGDSKPEKARRKPEKP